MIQCIDCLYVSADGRKHHDHCRLMLLEFVRQEGGKVADVAPITEKELAELDAMVAEMLRRGATRDEDGYFGICIPEA